MKMKTNNLLEKRFPERYFNQCIVFPGAAKKSEISGLEIRRLDGVKYRKEANGGGGHKSIGKAMGP